MYCRKDKIEGRQIVVGSVYYVSGISEMLHILHEPSFSSLDQLDTKYTDDTLSSSCFIQIFFIMFFTRLLNIGLRN